MSRVDASAVKAVMALGILLASCHFAFALDPSLDISQYAHTAWKVREGFTKGMISSIAQTPDGYLWLGTEFGLLRFDGVTNVPWEPLADQHLPSSDITSLLVARDGTFWMGTRKGLASWKDGKLTQYPALAGQAVGSLLEDREGTVWAGGLAVPPPGRLCAIHHGRVQCYGEDGRLGNGVLSLYEDSKGNLWAGVAAGLWRWKPGTPQFYPIPGEANGIQGLMGGDEGGLLVSLRGGIRRFMDGKTEVAYSYPGPDRLFEAQKLLRDREGSLWIGTSGRGLVHVHQGRQDVFTPSDGMSGGDIEALFEDREGAIWAATTNGLDRFREFAVATLDAHQGLPNPRAGAVLADRDGSVWLGTYGGLDRWYDGQIATWDGGEGKLEGRNPHSLLRDHRGRIWVSTRGGVGYLEEGRFIPISAVPGGIVHSMAEDKAGNLWIANQDLGLFRLSARGEVQQIPWGRLEPQDAAGVLASDPSQDGIWLGFLNGGVAYFRDGQVRASYAAAEGLGGGRVNSFQFDHQGILWIATEGGLSRLKNGHLATLTSKNGLPCDPVNWAIEDDDHSFWLNMPCGLVRAPRAELDAWAAAVDKGHDTTRKIQNKLFDSSDGLRSHSRASGYSPQVAKSTDGRLWFLPYDGVSVIDPRQLPVNKLPPPVHIEQITADRKTYWQNLFGDAASQLRLPPGMRDLEIDYTALSLVAPEKVRFRCKLEGRDGDWQDVGTRRQAFYSDLAPHSYRFRVAACNNSGVWNEAGDALEFSVAPAYYQTLWFRLACVAAFLTLLWTVYQLRLRSIQQRAEQLELMNARLEAQIIERKRAEEKLSQAQEELTRANRVMLVGETAASIAHEVNQPIAANVTNAGAGLRWLAVQPPELEEARQAFARIVTDGTRAGEVIGRIRALVKKSPSRKEWLNINETIREAVIITGNEVQKNRISLQTQLSNDLPPILADRVQLQQVILNLIKNAVEAMTGVSEGPRELRINSEKDGPKGVLVVVRDSGPGLDAMAIAHLFDHFYTTKPEGMGMGLAISRSIVEAHGGRLWVTPNEPHGAVFQFTLPTNSERIPSHSEGRSASSIPHTNTESGDD